MKKKKDNSEGTTSRQAFVLFWAVTCISFLFTIDASSNNAGKVLPTFLIILFVGNIFLGVLFFLGIFLKPFEAFKRSKFSRIVPYLVIIYFLFYVSSMTNGGWGLIAGMTTQKHLESLPAISIPTPTPTDTPTPVVQNSYIPPSDQDPIVDCTSSAPNCNGSSIKLHRSECSQITCCQIGNTWSVYPSSDKCKEAQNFTQQAPAKNTTQQSPGNNYYCWNNAYKYAYYTSSGDQCNLDNAKSSAYQTCMDTQKIKSNTCNLSCKTELDKENNICSWAYTGPNPGIANDPTKYGDCLNGPDGSGAHYGTCLSKCSDQYAQDIKQCSY